MFAEAPEVTSNDSPTNKVFPVPRNDIPTAVLKPVLALADDPVDLPLCGPGGGFGGRRDGVRE